jgi:hypothetical protein
MPQTTRMLERRVSNNRADLSGDQQMNYFLAWFKVVMGSNKSLKTRLKRLPVRIIRKHFRKTRTIYFYKHLLGRYLKYQSAKWLKKAIGISNTNCYFKYQLVL